MTEVVEGMEDLRMETEQELPYRIAENEEIGRHVVATREIPKGDVVFRDKPLITGLSRESEPACLACYNKIDITEQTGHVLCARCKWPLCSSSCSDSPVHQPECDFLSKADVEINAEDTDALYDVVSVLRCLYLRDNDITSWADLLNLQEANPDDMDEEVADRAKKVTGFICGTLKLGASFSPNIVFNVCTRLDVNSFEIPLGRDVAGIQVQGVYNLACMVEHCCIPTGHRTFNQDMSITLRSSYGLEEGDSVSVCYTDSLWPTSERREHLVYSKNFLCTCDRCLDSTENETYMSAVKCTKCPNGYFLPQNPIDCESHWLCTECRAQAPKGYSDMANSKTAATIAKIEEAGLTPDSCEKFISTYSKVLHSHHAHLLDVKYSLMQLLGHSTGCSMQQLTHQQLNTKEQLARTFLGIAQKVLPGISRLKGSSLFELYLTIQQRAVSALQDPSLQLSPVDVLLMLQAAGEHLQECLDTLQYEPAHQPEGALYRRAREEQAQLESLINRVKGQTTE